VGCHSGLDPEAHLYLSAEQLATTSIGQFLR
jgi:hypothetical protein